VEVVGKQVRVTFAGHTADAIPLPHPSGASTWHHMQPGKALLADALALLARHAAVRAAFGRKPRRPRKRASQMQKRGGSAAE
jgi:uracil-DNA glycosylase